MTGQNARTTALAAGAVAIIGLLSGCATPAGRGSSATITYEVDGQQKTTAFAPSNVTCNDRGAVSLSFPDKPFNGVSLSRGSTDTVEAWVYGDELIFFTSESVTVTQATDDGATTYVVSGRRARSPWPRWPKDPLTRLRMSMPRSAMPFDTPADSTSR